MKKSYKKPIICRLGLTVEYHILDGTVNNTGGNAGIGYEGGGNGGGRIKDRGTYGDLWAENEDVVIFDEEDEEL